MAEVVPHSIAPQLIRALAVDPAAQAVRHTHKHQSQPDGAPLDGAKKSVDRIGCYNTVTATDTQPRRPNARGMVAWQVHRTGSSLCKLVIQADDVGLELSLPGHARVRGAPLHLQFGI